MKPDALKLMFASTQMSFGRDSQLVTPRTKLKFDHKAKVEWKASASTWRHTSVSVSFSKANRFPSKKSNYNDQVVLVYPSQRTMRTTSMGFGGRHPISHWRLKEAAGVPGPYHNLSSDISNPEKGRSFMASRQHYEKIYNPDKKQPYAPFFTEAYPPAHYQVREVPGRHARKHMFGKRLKMFNQMEAESKGHVPGAKYEVSEELGRRDRGFGFGNRINFSKPLNQNPGPIYNLVRQFDIKE